MITLVLSGLFRGVRTQRALVLENLALRHQLIVLRRSTPRPRLRPSNRLFWVLLSRLWHGWAEAVAIVQPETVIRWHRTGFKLLWTWKSRQRGPGRPAVAPELRALIRRMAEANPLWGAPRIHGELRKLGLQISQATVSKYLVRRRTPPSQTWRTFLANHVGTLISVDFFVVPTVLFKVLFVFVVLAHDRRRVVHVNVTDSPTAQWAAQQLVEAFPWDTAPRYLLRDRDAVYGVVFSSRVQALGIREVKTAPRSPWQNPYVERLIGTLRHECPTTWWCSTRSTCVTCCATTLPTTTVPGPTSHWRRTPRSRDRCSASTKAGLSRPPWSAASIIATRARRRKIRPACGGDRPRGSRRSAGQRGSPRSSSTWSLKLHTEHVGPRGCPSEPRPGAADERPQPVLRTPGRVRRKGQVMQNATGADDVLDRPCALMSCASHRAHAHPRRAVRAVVSGTAGHISPR